MYGGDSVFIQWRTLVLSVLKLRLLLPGLVIIKLLM